MIGLAWTAFWATTIGGLIAAYLRQGFRYARKSAPTVLQKAQKRYVGHSTSFAETHTRLDFKWAMVRCVLFWPLRSTVGDGLDGLYDAAVSGDPKVLKTRIKDLERELGLR